MTEAKKPTKIEAIDSKLAALQKQVDTLTTERAELVAAEEAAAKLAAARKAIDVDGLPADTAVVFDYGRSTSRKLGLTGKTRYFRAAAGEVPAAYRVEYDTDAGPEIVTVPARDVRLPEEPAQVFERVEDKGGEFGGVAA